MLHRVVLAADAVPHHLFPPAERIGSPRHPNFVDRRRFNERMLFHDPTPLYFTNKMAQRKANTTKLAGGPLSLVDPVNMVDGRSHGIALPNLSGLFATCESGLLLPSSLYLQPPATARPTAEKRSHRHDTPTVARVYGVDNVHVCEQQQRRHQRLQLQPQHGLHSASEVVQLGDCPTEYSEMVESSLPPGLHPQPALSQQERRLREYQWKEEQAILRAEMAAAYGKNARKDVERELLARDRARRPLPTRLTPACR